MHDMSWALLLFGLHPGAPVNLTPSRFIAAMLGACLLSAGMPTLASMRPENITDAEWALVPPYCPHTMGFKGHTQPFVGKWVAVMGKSFFHVHHYCWALIDLHRAERAALAAPDKRYLRQRALGGFWYVIQNAEEDFVLLPEIFTWIGRTEVLLGHGKNAGDAFAKAMALKPDYWPPYYHWGEFLKSQGKKNEALEIVRSGLSQVPSAKPLLLLFRDLGGKPTDLPPPIRPPDAASVPRQSSGTSIPQAPAPAAQ